MSALESLQRLFASVLMDGAEPEALLALVSGDARGSAEERVAIYTEMYRLRLVEVLGEVYPRCAGLLGASRFAELANTYLRAHPSRSPSLRDYGAQLAEHLDEPSLAALARLEWARYDVFDAEDEPTLTGAALAALPPEHIAALPLRRILASRLLELDHDIVSLYRDEQSSPEAPRAATVLLVWRDGLRVFHRRVDADEAALLSQLDGSLTLAALCERQAAEQPVERAAQAVFALVGRWVADGLLVVPEPWTYTETP